MLKNKVREFREKAGLSQAELARRVRIAGPNLSAIEHEKLAPWPKVKRDLSRVLKVPQKKLFPTEKRGQDAE